MLTLSAATLGVPVQQQQQQPAAPSCPGFAACPTAFPMPYNGTYPAAYPYEPGRAFASDFMWGLGTASYQIEGAYNEGGRGASIWDTFSGANTVGMPGSVCSAMPCPVSSVMKVPGATGNVANDHYHKYAQDVAVMKSIGLKTYRFSIAWPRIFPTGHAEAGANAEGVAFYHKLIDALIAAGVTPVVTMYHWDLPQGLLDASPTHAPPVCDSRYKQGWFECTQDKEGGGRPVPSGFDAEVVKQFGAYAEFILGEYGSKVQTWVTFNEAWTFTFLGSGGRGKAPNLHPYDDADVWPYVAGHNVVLAHLSAVRTFRAMQKAGTLGAGHTIGITNNQDWREPKTHAPLDIAAAEAQLQGQLGWYADPIYGVDGVHDYPDTMKRLLPYLPEFTAEQKAALEASPPDFFGLNHYGTGFARWDAATNATVVDEDGIVEGESVWLFGAAWGFRKLLNWVSNRYGKAYPIFCTEAGWSVAAKNALEAKYDSGRVMYYYSYLSEAWQAIHADGVQLKGFFAWSLMDNYEWEMGYSERFGAMFNDFNFSSDPNAPDAATPVYDFASGKVVGTCGARCSEAGVPDPSSAYRQTRHAKNSLLWMQWLWQLNELPDPARFLASTIGGDVCYGVGQYTVSGQTVDCALSSDLPGPAPRLRLGDVGVEVA